MHITINSVIEDFKRLSLDDEEYAVEVATKQLIERKRQAILCRAKEAQGNLKNKLVKKGAIKDLYKDLENA